MANLDNDPRGIGQALQLMLRIFPVSKVDFPFIALF